MATGSKAVLPGSSPIHQKEEHHCSEQSREQVPCTRLTTESLGKEVNEDCGEQCADSQADQIVERSRFAREKISRSEYPAGDPETSNTRNEGSTNYFDQDLSGPIA